MNTSSHFNSTTVSTTKPTNFVDFLQNKFHGTNYLQFLRYSSSISLISHNRASSCNKNGSKTQKQNQLKPIKSMVADNQKDGRFGLGFTKGDKSNQIGDNGVNNTMEKIVEKLKNYGFVDDDEQEIVQERSFKQESMEDIEGNISKTRDNFSKISSFSSNQEVKFPWEKIRNEETEEEWTAKKESRYSLAQKILPESELNRLRNLTFRTNSKMRIKGAGVTQTVVEAIQEKWKSSEIVRLKVEGDNALNMRKMHEILERKTGGLVIWRSGTAISLYKYKSGDKSEKLNKQRHKRLEASPSLLPPRTSRVEHRDILQEEDIAERKETSQEQVEYEDEIDELLDGLGPRYTDWQGAKPLPIDADLLPGIVPGYESPFRVVPYGVRSTIGHKEATALRRLANVVPPHFALGRSRHLQGLATAMVKLWQKSSIVKIALKRGIQLTTSERMAEDIKRLTGGMLLSRSKDFLVFYRGKSFLTEELAKALQEKERLAVTLQDDEEQARLRASSALVNPSTKPNQNRIVSAGSLEETLDASGKWGKNLEEDDNIEEMKQEAEKARHANIIRKLEKKLAFAERKLKKAERDLAKVEECLNPAEQRGDFESITEEERFMFRKLGLKMKAFLLLGRRGVFDGTVENMHLHWKYRELIKILVKVRNYENAKKLALALEAESGGVLVSVDKVSKGYAIIVYRGKDYTRPTTLRPKNLLTKRKALARSVELQRREGLLKHIGVVKARSEKLRAEIKQMELVGDKGDETLYSKLDETYLSGDDETEEIDEEEDVEEDGEEDESWVHGSLSDDENWDSDESDIDFDDDIESITTPEEEASDLQSEQLLSATVDN